MSTELVKSITGTFKELNNVLAPFTDKQLNTVPFEGSWTAGQTTEHILKVLNGIPELMRDASNEPGRDPAEKIKPLHDLFLDFSNRMQAPDFVYPLGTEHQKEELIKELKRSETELLDALDQDLSWVCTSFEFPVFGYFTRLEWIHFFIVHTQRHTQQLKNIFNSFK